MRYRFLFFIATFLLSSIVSKAADVATVRVIYLVSADREPREEYRRALEMAITNIQHWYAKQLGGATFRLHSPVVEVVRSKKPAAWFYGNPRKGNKDNWGYDNTFEEAAQLVGSRHFDKNHVWVIYSDGPGNKGRGGSGVCVMPEDDLLGLTGRHPKEKEINRWIAGLGHEIGHAFGLPHPRDATDLRNAIMGAGIYGRYPDQTYLTASDKKALLQSPYFYDATGVPVTGKTDIVGTFAYAGGKFYRRQNQKTKATDWQEVTDTGDAFLFSERPLPGGAFELQAVNREIRIRIPRGGGRSEISTDQGRSWRPFYQLTSE